jgi:hypothetical protein
MAFHNGPENQLTKSREQGDFIVSTDCDEKGPALFFIYYFG